MATRRLFLVIVLLFIILSLSACSTPGRIKPTDLRPFTSDQCSMFPEGTRKDKELWCHCCFEHDRVYWRGGTYEERKKADEELKKCVTKMGKKHVAIAMKLGVRLGGSPYYPTSFRWGYGWPYLRGYKEVSTEEDEMVNLKWKSYEDSGVPPVCLSGN